jgi:hypothetical protein
MNILFFTAFILFDKIFSMLLVFGICKCGTLTLRIIVLIRCPGSVFDC